MSNLYTELDLFLDPATTDTDQLKSELQDKIKVWNRNPGMYSYQIHLANDFIKNSGNYNLAQLANDSRSEKEQAGKLEAAVYEEDGIVEAQEVEALVNKYKKWFTRQTITSWFTLQVQSGAQFVPPQEPDYLKTAKVVSTGDMKKLAIDLKIVLGKDDATMYDLLGMKQSESCDELEAKRLALYADSQKDPNRGRNPVVDTKIRLLGKLFFKDEQSKKGYNTAISIYAFYSLVESELRARAIKGYITVDDYENSIKKTVAVGIGRKTAEWLVYNFYYNTCGIKEPPRMIARVKNESEPKAKQIIRAIENAKTYKKPIEHILILRPSDPGSIHKIKSLVINIANYLGVPMQITEGAEFAEYLVHNEEGDDYHHLGIVKLFMSLIYAKEGSVLFINEIHLMDKNVQIFLSSVMKDLRVDTVLDDGVVGARAMSMPIKPFTLIGATTNINELSSGLRDRFQMYLEFQTLDEMDEVIHLLDNKK